MKIAPKEPFVRSPYNYNTDAASNESGLRCEDASLTQQHQKDQADINYIIDQFNVTGILPTVPVSPQYGDFTGISDYQSALNAVIDAQDEFMSLPANLRARFDNDPVNLINFLNNEENRQEAIELGLLEPIQQAAIAAPNEDITPLQGAAEAAQHSVLLDVTVLGDTKTTNKQKKEHLMRILKRTGYGRKSKMKSVKHFKHRTKHTKSPNMQTKPQRGGWRL